MTKKDYELIASVMLELGEMLHPLKLYLLHEKICNILSEKLSSQNTRFDKEKFLKACGCVSFDEGNI